MNLEEVKKIQFLIDQMTHKNAHATTTMKTAVSLYLRSRNCFSGIEKKLNLPHPNAIKNYFGTIDSLVEIHECENTINIVFSKLINEQKYWEILFDEIHIKPASRY